MSLAVAVHATVREIPEWDTIRPGASAYMAAWWFEHLERLFGDAVSAAYVTVRDGGVVVAAAPCWTIPRKGIIAPPLEAPRLFARWELVDGQLKKFPGAPMPEDELFPYTLVGPIRGYEGHLLVRPDLDAATRRQVIEQLFAGVAETARRAGSKVLFVPYLTADHAEELADALGSRVLGGYGVTDCWLAPVTSLEDYLASFTSHRRNSIRQEISKFAKEGFRVEVRRLGEMIDQADPLITGSNSKLGWTVDSERMRRELALLGSHHDEHTLLFCVLRGDELAAVNLLISHEGRHYGRALGFAAERSERSGLYFNLIFYIPIARARDHGVREIHYGGASLEAKVRRGCSVIGLWNLAVPLVPWNDDARAAIVRGGESMLAADLAVLGDLLAPEDLERQLGLARIRALQARFASR